MRDATKFREEAEYYVRLAQAAPSVSRRIRLLEIAQSLLHLAEETSEANPVCASDHSLHCHYAQ